MAEYFSLPHLGAGTVEVEGLSSYLTRMAQAHGCSEWQLASHLRAWWERTHSQGSADRFPSIAHSTCRTPLCGMGSDVEKLVVALRHATGVTTLRSGTMMPIAPALSPTSIGVLRTSRAWCPACYTEDSKSNQPLYDRLLWALLPVTRCRAHRIELTDRCPACTSPQLARAGSRLDVCNVCGAGLLAASPQFSSAKRPAFGEDLIYELIEACACDPTVTINRQSMRLFFKRHRRELPAGDPLLAIPSLTSGTSRPSLASILRMATAFNVSLLDFQSSEPPETTRELYGPASPPLPRTFRPRHSREVRDRVEAALSRALKGPKVLVSFRLFCAQQGVSTGYVLHQLPCQARAYIARRKDWATASGRSKLHAAQTVAGSGLVEDYQQGRIKQLKDLIREVASAAGVSIVTARKAVKLCMAAEGFEGSD